MATSQPVLYQRVSPEDTAEVRGQRSPDAVAAGNRKWERVWRVACAVMCVFFLLCAYVQINDPDPYIWIPVYTIPAVLCVTLVWDPTCADSPLWSWVCTAHIGCTILGAAYTLALVIERMDRTVYNPLVHEEGRELAGLAIIIFWLSICRFSSLGHETSYQSWRHGLLVLLGISSLLPLVMWSLCFIDAVHGSLSHCRGMFPDAERKATA